MTLICLLNEMSLMNPLVRIMLNKKSKCGPKKVLSYHIKPEE